MARLLGSQNSTFFWARQKEMSDLCWPHSEVGWPSTSRKVSFNLWCKLENLEEPIKLIDPWYLILIFWINPLGWALEISFLWNILGNSDPRDSQVALGIYLTLSHIPLVPKCPVFVPVSLILTGLKLRYKFEKCETHKPYPIVSNTKLKNVAAHR